MKPIGKYTAFETFLLTCYKEITVFEPQFLYL